MNRRTRTVALATVSLAALSGACSSAGTDGGAKGTTAEVRGADSSMLDLRNGVTNEVPVYDAPGDITMKGGIGPTVESGPNVVWNLPKFSEVTILCRATATRLFPGSPGGSGDFGLPPTPPTNSPLVYFKINYGKGTGYVVMESIRITGRSTDTNAVIQDSDIKAC